MITPSDPAAAPELYAAVQESGFDILAGQPDLSGLCSAAQSEAMARQPDTERLLQSPQGYGAFSITSGTSHGGGEDWPSDVSPGA